VAFIMRYVAFLHRIEYMAGEIFQEKVLDKGGSEDIESSGGPDEKELVI
jgi:hypothetical protein